MRSSTNPKVLRKIASFAGEYEKHVFLPSMESVSYLLDRPSCFTDTHSVGVAWLEDSLLALASAPWYGYARQGAPERYWRLAAQAIRQAAAKVGQHSPAFTEEIWSNFEVLCQHPKYCTLQKDQEKNPIKPNKKMPVIKDLASLHLEIENIMGYLRQNFEVDAATCHMYIKSRIRGMGDKTTAFLLRDIAWVYGLEGKGSLTNAYNASHIQPIDIRVRQVAQCLWPQLEGREWLVVAQHIVEQCSKADVSPIQFNQGAWYLGARIIRNASNFCQRLNQLDC